MKTLSFITCLTAFLLLFGSFSQAYAQSPSPDDGTQATENLKNRLKQTIGEETTTNSLTLAKGYVGKVKDIVKNTLVFEDKEGKKNLQITDDSLILRSPGNSEIDLPSVRLDDSIIVMGYPLENSEIDGRRIIVSTLPFTPPTKASGFGIIAAITKNTLTLTSPSSEDSLILTTTAKTLYKTPLGILDSTDLTIGDTVIYTALVNDNQDLTTTVLMKIKTATSPSPEE
ncbi:MAG: hypothetical protein ABII80_03390 [bacterium]